jgi:predicted unusual protein kinase regulating ubiquinone biosynthesis (AarF/ABC1/UbiB family)
MKTAEQVAETLGNMKGVLMKLGQMASFVDEGIPDAFREALAQLQADAPPMSGELAASVVEQELGTPPDRLFAEWDPVPIASASIGQVHRALTHEGQAVAVKVQYPGVDKAIAGDLENVSVLYNAASLMFRGLDPKGIVDELSERFTEELDYRTEADHQRLFGRLYAGHPFIHIPAVIDRYSTGRVLTTELADGARFAEVEQWPEDERNRAAETIYRFAFRSIYRFSVFNGDPHPGNYLFHRGGGVTFLDFGLVKRFSPDEQVERSAIVEAAVIHRSPAELRTVLERVGFLKAGAPFSDADVDDYFGYFFLPVQEDRPYHYTKEFAIEALHRTFDPSGPHGDLMRWMNIPPAFVILNRIQWGLNAIMARLGATANWRRIAEELWPFTDGPASTELGRQEATWWEERHAP